MLCLLFVLTLGNAQLMCPSLLWESWFDCGNNVAPDASGCCPDGGCPPGCRSASWTCCPRVCTCTGCPYARKPLLQAMTIQDQWVKAHNYFRCRHGNAPLAWNTQVATNAYNWANVGSGCNVYHSDSLNNNPPSGENIMEGFVNPFDAVSWMYSEIAYYTPNSGAGTCSAVCGHYTAMIWNSTTALGCGTCASKKYDVCQYALSPPNYNAPTQAPLNVPRSNTPIRSENECCNRIFAPGASTTAPTPASPCGLDVTVWGTWPPTQPNILHSMTCPPGYTGTVSRRCGNNGIWQDVDPTGCIVEIPDCPAENGWPRTAPSLTSAKPCPTGQVGINTRQCSSTGQWGLEVNTCVAPATCTDGVQNQGEEGIDCGCLTCTPPCPACRVCDEITCGVNGQCIEPNPVCVCSNGYTGTRCETPPPDPCSTVNCGAFGNCIAGNCSCFGGYSGPTCSTPLAPTCTDGIQNSDEAGIDCGGVIAGCFACPNHQWRPGNWTACSRTCGSGTQTRTVSCVSTVTGLAVGETFCGNAHTHSTSQACNVDPCPTYRWEAGSWGPCSTSCNGGNQTRSVDCYSSAGNVIVPSGCDMSVKPPSVESCNTEPCLQARWVSAPWGPCTLECGGGFQTRTVNCQDQTDTPVSVLECSLNPRPATQQGCNFLPCDGYRWRACPTFYPCTAQCNGGGAMAGVQYRDVFCIRDSDGTAVDPNLCNLIEKPTSSLTICNTQPCSNYNWMADDNWGPCTLQANGLFQRTRTFHCHAADGSTALRQECVEKAGKLPISVLPCSAGTCANLNGCPTVEIAEVLNSCDITGLSDCNADSNCIQAANAVDLSFLSVGVTASNAKQCVLDYVDSLAISARPSEALVKAITARLEAGQKLCGGVISAAPRVAASVLLSCLTWAML